MAHSPPPLGIGLTVQQQVDLIVGAMETRMWSVLALPGFSLGGTLGASGFLAFLLFRVVVPAMEMFEEMTKTGAPLKAGMKAIGALCVVYCGYALATLFQHQYERNKARVSFNECFPQGAQARAGALQALAVKPGPAAKMLFKALGGLSVVTAVAVSLEPAVVDPIPIQADDAPAPAPTAKQGYILLQPEERRPDKGGGDEPKRAH